MAKRASGVLLHPTSLPGSHGIGDLGAEARQFLGWLESAGQSVWQLLPIGPTAMGNSPYTAASSYAGNELLIALQPLAESGLLSPTELEPLSESPANRVDFESLRPRKTLLLRAAWRRFAENGQAARRELEAWATADSQARWLEDWTLYSALKAQQTWRPWWEWPVPLRDRDSRAVASLREELAEEIDFHRFVQFIFSRQWQELRSEASSRQVELFGDLPFYPALDSCDVWADREMFELDRQGRPLVVAGVPPDYFSPTGQLWGNPVYRWERMAETGFRWWIDRLAAQLARFERVRLDHFRGFAGYWVVDAGNHTAEKGCWRTGPGLRLFEAARQELGELPLMAEDLGMVTPDVEQLRRRLGLPGMKVLQFGFDELDSPHLPHHAESDSVLFTGTHDNDTTVGWFESLAPASRQRALDYLGGNGTRIHWDLIRAALTSSAELTILPVQDLLGLGTEHRMNRPGIALGNWEWRLEPRQLTPETAGRLLRLTELTGRLPSPARPAKVAAGTPPSR